jgi:hypothetical protein
MNANEQLFFQQYVVAFVDLLGQSAVLSALDDIDLSSATPEMLQPKFAEAFAPVLVLRQDIDRYFEEAERSPDPRLPEQARQMILDGRQVLRFAMSDSMVLAVPLAGAQIEGLRVVGISHLFQCLVSTMFVSLFRQSPIRGAIDLGLATQLSAGEIYGGALARAHRAESKCADYPRIVVGRRVTHFLRVVRDMKGDSIAQQFARQTADRCLQMLGRDHDGCTVLDYLGPYFHNASYSEISTERVQAAFDWARSEARRFEAAGRGEISRKYYQLASYFRAKSKE